METTPGTRELAWRLLAHEAGESVDAVGLASATETACQRLRGRLVVVIGPLGFRAILAHAVRQTRLECPEPFADLSLPTLSRGEPIPEPETGPLLKGLPECVQGRDPIEVRDALTELFASVLAVLVDLMGRNLTHEFLRAAWPEVSIE